jgi:hypothetical protein
MMQVTTTFASKITIDLSFSQCHNQHHAARGFGRSR